MWSAEQNISQAGKGVFHKIPGHVRDKNTGNLYTFFSFLFQQKIRPRGCLYGRLCRTRAFCLRRLSGPQYYLPSFQQFKQKRWSRGRFNRFLPFLVKDPSLLCRRFKQFLWKVLCLRRPIYQLHIAPPLVPAFCYLLTTPRFGALKSWKRVFRKSTSLPETVSAWSA